MMPTDPPPRGLWLDTAGPLTPRAPLPGDAQVDVAIVGAGMTGLWTAYHLAKAAPDMRIAVIERDVAGYGASGRNGGWASAYFDAGRETLLALHGEDATRRMQAAMADAVDAVGADCAAEGIDAEYHKGGSFAVARTQPQLQRLRDALKDARAWGYTEDEYEFLDGAATRDRLVADGVLGSVFTPQCAVVNPAKLTRGLADVCERLGVTIWEQTTAEAIATGKVRTPRGIVRADVVVRALEGYTPTLEGHERLVAPIEIKMIATEPLPASFWDAVGWRDREAVSTTEKMFAYIQRTIDDRIAIGSGVPKYHFGSATPEVADTGPDYERIRQGLIELFPGTADAEITHRWGGYCASPRDWYASVGLDRERGIAWAGGYVGDGVTTAHLAGRTIRDLVLDRDTDETRLPWVNHPWQQWEPEPLRWLGINTAMRVAGRMDRTEARTGTPSKLGTLMAKLMGTDTPSSPIP